MILEAEYCAKHPNSILESFCTPDDPEGKIKKCIRCYEEKDLILKAQYCKKHTTTTLDRIATLDDPLAHFYKCRECLAEKAVEMIEETVRDSILDFNSKYTNTPNYYNTDKGDLYDFFIAHLGLSTWIDHALMETVQYCLRAKAKGSFEQDIRKAIVILERILKETNGNIS